MHAELALVAWLRVRHIRTSLIYWVRVTGVDLDEEADVLDRLYQIYVVALLGAWAVAAWSALLSQTAIGFGSLTSPVAAALLSSAPLMALSAFGTLYFRTGRSSPLKLSAPAIAYVASSPLDTRAVISVDLAVLTGKVAAVSALLGYLLGFGIRAAGLHAVPWQYSLLATLTAACVVLASWIAGMTRLSVDRRAWRMGWIASWPAIIVLGVGMALSQTAVAGNAEAIFGPETCIAMGVTLIVGWLILMTLSRGVRMVDVIDESWLYSQLETLSRLRLFDAQAYREIARRKRLASRPPRFRLPRVQGAATPVARAALSYARQPGRIPSLLVWGAFIAPAGAVLMLSQAAPLLLLPWAAVTVMGTSRELARVFSDDLEHPQVRSTLPLSTMRLLALDSLPAVAVAVVASTVSMIVLALVGIPFVTGLALSVLLTVLAVICRGIGLLREPHTGKTLSYEASMLVSVAVIGGASLYDKASLTLVVAGVVTVVAGIIARSRRE